MRAGMLSIIVFLFCLGGVTLAQTPMKVHRAELSIPFGVTSGHILLVGDYLIFVDAEKPDASFAIAKSDIRHMIAEGGVITLETRQPVRDRTGERSTLSFRLQEVEVGSVMNWSSAPASPLPTPVAGQRPTAETPAMTPSPTTTPAHTLNYEAKHKHTLFGSCSGTITITNERITYESTDNIGHSRQWRMADIREVKQNGPYFFEVEPFIGSRYRFEIGGQGMDIQDFKMVVLHITAARATR